ncbi:hypothetical protein ACH4OX_08485 [Streptomyces roseolus]|uniref:hypothetical protein n=1 Tax=Streptomyces roseolus TaxID=67358 RepID=UPI0037A5B2E9
MAALLRIAFLLERGGAPAYRARAFRTAARAVDALPGGEAEYRAAGRGRAVRWGGFRRAARPSSRCRTP